MAQSLIKKLDKVERIEVDEDDNSVMNISFPISKVPGRVVIEADHVFIEGKVSGSIIARKTLELSGTSTLIGDAAYDTLLDIHPRAKVRGKLEYRGDLEGLSNGLR